MGLAKPTSTSPTVTAASTTMSRRPPFIALCSPSGYRVTCPLIDRNGFQTSSNPPAFRHQQNQEYRQYADPDRQRPPQQAHPGWGDGIGNDLVRRWDIIFRPSCDLSVVERLRLSPADEGQQRLVVRIVHKDIFQAIAVGVFEHRP